MSIFDDFDIDLDNCYIAPKKKMEKRRENAAKLHKLGVTVL